MLTIRNRQKYIDYLFIPTYSLMFVYVLENTSYHFKSLLYENAYIYIDYWFIIHIINCFLLIHIYPYSMSIYKYMSFVICWEILENICIPQLHSSFSFYKENIRDTFGDIIASIPGAIYLYINNINKMHKIKYMTSSSDMDKYSFSNYFYNILLSVNTFIVSISSALMGILFVIGEQMENIFTGVFYLWDTYMDKCGRKNTIMSPNTKNPYLIEYNILFNMPFYTPPFNVYFIMIVSNETHDFFMDNTSNYVNISLYGSYLETILKILTPESHANFKQHSALDIYKRKGEEGVNYSLASNISHSGFLQISFKRKRDNGYWIRKTESEKEIDINDKNQNYTDYKWVGMDKKKED